jgi:hypothetical protein
MSTADDVIVPAAAAIVGPGMLTPLYDKVIPLAGADSDVEDSVVAPDVSESVSWIETGFPFASTKPSLMITSLSASSATTSTPTVCADPGVTPFGASVT